MASEDLRLSLRGRKRICRAIADKINPYMNSISARELGVGREPGRPPITSEVDTEGGRISWTLPAELTESLLESNIQDYVSHMNWGNLLFDLNEDFEGSVGPRLHRGEESRFKGGVTLADILGRSIKLAGGKGVGPRDEPFQGGLI